MASTRVPARPDASTLMCARRESGLTCETQRSSQYLARSTRKIDWMLRPAPRGRIGASRRHVWLSRDWPQGISVADALARQLPIRPFWVLRLTGDMIRRAHGTLSAQVAGAFSDVRTPNSTIRERPVLMKKLPGICYVRRGLHGTIALAPSRPRARAPALRIANRALTPEHHLACRTRPTSRIR